MKALKLILAWTGIALPLGWGVYQSVQKSLPLFQESKPDETIVMRDDAAATSLPLPH